MFKFRYRMADFEENFRGALCPRPCQLCGLHLDNQETSFQCPEITKQMEIKVEYSKIFQKKIPVEIFETISRITAIRDEMKNWTNWICLNMRPTAQNEQLFIWVFLWIVLFLNYTQNCWLNIYIYIKLIEINFHYNICTLYIFWSLRWPSHKQAMLNRGAEPHRLLNK